jgi:hypothetical protein
VWARTSIASRAQPKSVTAYTDANGSFTEPVCALVLAPNQLDSSRETVTLIAGASGALLVCVPGHS